MEQPNPQRNLTNSGEEGSSADIVRQKTLVDYQTLNIDMNKFSSVQEFRRHIKEFRQESINFNSPTETILISRIIEKEEPIMFSAEHLAALIKMIKRLAQNIRTVQITFCGLNNQAITELLPALRLCTNLESLTLASNALDDNSMVNLANALKTNCWPKLNTLALGGNKSITLGGLNALLKGLANYKLTLRYLTLNGIALGDAGATYISNWLSASASYFSVDYWRGKHTRPILQSLGLANTGLTDEGIKILIPGLRNVANLANFYLNIADNRSLTRAAFDLLAQQDPHPNASTTSAFKRNLTKQQEAYNANRTENSYRRSTIRGNKERAGQLVPELLRKKSSHPETIRQVVAQNIEVYNQQTDLLALEKYIVNIKEQQLMVSQRQALSKEVMGVATSSCLQPLHQWLAQENIFWQRIDKIIIFLKEGHLPPELNQTLLKLLNPILKMHYIFEYVSAITGNTFKQVMSELLMAINSERFAQHYLALKEYQQLYTTLHSDLTKQINSWCNTQSKYTLQEIKQWLETPLKQLEFYSSILEELAQVFDKENKQHNYTDSETGQVYNDMPSLPDAIMMVTHMAERIENLNKGITDKAGPQETSEERKKTPDEKALLIEKSIHTTELPESEDITKFASPSSFNEKNFCTSATVKVAQPMPELSVNTTVSAEMTIAVVENVEKNSEKSSQTKESVFEPQQKISLPTTLTQAEPILFFSAPLSEEKKSVASAQTEKEIEKEVSKETPPTINPLLAGIIILEDDATRRSSITSFSPSGQ